MYRTRDGRVFYTTSTSQRGNGFNFEYSYSSQDGGGGRGFWGSVLFGIVSTLIPALPLLLCFCCVWCVTGAFAPQRPKQPANKATNSSNTTQAAPSSAQSTDSSVNSTTTSTNKIIVELTSEHLSRKGQILIIALSSAGIAECSALVHQFRNDPVRFVFVNPARISPEDPLFRYRCVAVTKGGTRWTGLPAQVLVSCCEFCEFVCKLNT